MGKYVMVVQSQAKPGRDDDYNDWYDTAHFRDICSVPGVKGGRRFEATPIAVGAPGLKYLALYEIETDDIGALMAYTGQKSANGEFSQSDALDQPSAVLWVYEQREKQPG